MPLTANLLREVSAIDSQSDYVAVELLWNALVKAAHAKNKRDEFERLLLLIGDLQPAQVAALMQHHSVDTLLNLHPPLETVLADPNERLYTRRAADELATIRAARDADPNKAAAALLSVLKRIRNKRMHGFKTPDGPRDAEILGAARPLLRVLCHSLIH
jgi:hypothetical protein